MPFWCRMYPGTGYNWPWSTFPRIKNAIHKLQRTPPSRNGVTAEHGFEVSHWMIPHQWLISQRQQRAIFRQLANELSCRWSGESDPKIAGRGWIKFDIAGSTAKLSGPTTSPKFLKTRTFPWREWLWANSARKTSVGIDKINAITEEPIVIEPFSVAQQDDRRVSSPRKRPRTTSNGRILEPDAMVSMSTVIQGENKGQHIFTWWSFCSSAAANTFN